MKRDLAGLGVVQQVQPAAVAAQPGAQLLRAASRSRWSSTSSCCSASISSSRAMAASDRGRPCLVAQPRLVGLVGPQAERRTSGAKVSALPDQRDQHDDERAEQQQVAVRERGTVGGDQRQREDRRQGDHASGAGPAQGDDLAPVSRWARARRRRRLAGRRPRPPSQVCSDLGSDWVNTSHTGRSNNTTPTVIVDRDDNRARSYCSSPRTTRATAAQSAGTRNLRAGSRPAARPRWSAAGSRRRPDRARGDR